MSKNNDHFYVEKRDDGSFAASRGGAKRVSYTGATQGNVLNQLKHKQPDAPLHIESARNTKVGSPDKWR